MLEEYRLITKLDPESEGAYYGMGLMQAKLKQYDEAIASFHKEQEKNGDSAEIENALAEAYTAKGMKTEAEAARKQAESLKNP